MFIEPHSCHEHCGAASQHLVVFIHITSTIPLFIVHMRMDEYNYTHSRSHIVVWNIEQCWNTEAETAQSACVSGPRVSARTSYLKKFSMLSSVISNLCPFQTLSQMKNNFSSLVITVWWWVRCLTLSALHCNLIICRTEVGNLWPLGHFIHLTFWSEFINTKKLLLFSPIKNLL